MNSLRENIIKVRYGFMLAVISLGLAVVVLPQVVFGLTVDDLVVSNKISQLDGAQTNTFAGKVEINNALTVSGAVRVPKQGNISMGSYTNGVSDKGVVSTNITMNGNKLVDLGEPASDKDAATKKYVDSLLPKGLINAYGGTNAPSGWLMCNGSAVSRTTYSNLFNVIGTSFGVGNGSTTFNLPDLRQRFPMGKSASGTGSTLGGTGGNIDHSHTTASHTLTTGEMPYHRHGHAFDDGFSGYVSWPKVWDGSGNHDWSGWGTGPYEVNLDPYTGYEGGGGGHDHGSTGTANPPYQVVNYIIKY